MANVDIRLGHKNTAWFTTNSTLVLKDGQMVVCSDGANQGKYKIGDGTTQLSVLTFYGGVSVSPAWGSITGTLSSQTDLQTALNNKQNTITTGTTAQYLRGDLSLATFPTNVSSFTNDSGYITSSALSPYLTGLTVGSTTIGSGTNTRILYNNSGVLGEYTVTGTGTTAVLSTSPTFTTGIQINSGTNSGRAFELFQDTASVKIGSRVGTTSHGAIYFSAASPSDASSFVSGSTSLLISGGNGLNICVGTTPAINLNSFNEHTYTNIARSSGATTAFTWTKANSTGQTASTNIPGFLFTTGSRQWATGAITTQEEIRITSPTYSFVGPSTITNAYTLFVNSPTAGTNATITNNWAAGFNGRVQITGRTYTPEIWSTGTTLDIWTSNFNFIACNQASSTASLTFGSVTRNGGAAVAWVFNPATNTNLTASAEVPLMTMESATKTWSTGAITNQRAVHLKTQTYAFVSASTITNSYGLYVEAATAGTNATITNNYALGTSGDIRLDIPSTTTYWRIGAQSGSSFAGAIYHLASATAITTTNHVLRHDQTNTELNTSYTNGYISLQTAANDRLKLFGVVTTGAVNNFAFSAASNTGQTASTEISGYLYNSYSRQWATGNITTQRERWYRTVTYSFVGASTITNAYGAYFEAPTAGTNATITNNYAAGFSGNVHAIVGTSTNGLKFQGWTSDTTIPAIYNQATPSAGNYSLLFEPTNTYINGTSTVHTRINNTSVLTISSTQLLLASGINIATNTTTGTKIGTATNEKIGFWNATPIVQPTTAVAAATVVSGTGGNVKHDDTFDGYTLEQIVKALRNIGLLA